MNSIQEEQLEEDRANHFGGDANAKINALVEFAQTCFLHKRIRGDSTGARPMNARVARLAMDSIDKGLNWRAADECA